MRKHNRYSADINSKQEAYNLSQMIKSTNNTILDENEFNAKEKTFQKFDKFLDSAYEKTGNQIVKESDPKKQESLIQQFLLLGDFKKYLAIKKTYEIDNHKLNNTYKPLLKESDREIVSWLNKKIGKEKNPRMFINNCENKLKTMKRKDDVKKYDFLNRAVKIYKTYYE